MLMMMIQLMMLSLDTTTPEDVNHVTSLAPPAGCNCDEIPVAMSSTNLRYFFNGLEQLGNRLLSSSHVVDHLVAQSADAEQNRLTNVGGCSLEG